MFDFVLRKFTQHSSHQIAAAAAGFHKSVCVCLRCPWAQGFNEVVRASNEQSRVGK